MGGRGERLAQCSVVKIVTRKAIPAQVDGEPCRLAPSVIEMRFHSRVPMLQRISSKVRQAAKDLHTMKSKTSCTADRKSAWVISRPAGQ